MSNFLKALKVKGIEIDTAGATTGDVLKYDGTKFGAASVGGSAVGALDDLSDVVITAPTKYQLLEYDGTTWVNTEPTVTTYVRNGEATTLNVGEVVYLSGQQGNRAEVKRAINTGDATSAKTLGIVGASIASAADGPVVTQGYAYNLNLGSYTAGQTLYLSSTAGAMTATKPYAPNHLVYVGVVVRANNGNGILYVRAQNGYELDEIHDVDLTTTPPTAGQYLRFGGSVWTADTIDLGTDTTGNYVGTIAAGTGVSTTGASTGEGVAHTISIGQDVATSASPSFAGLTVDTNTLYVDASNNRVGIGTTSPGATLDVQSSSINPTIRATNSGAGNALTVVGNAGVSQTLTVTQDFYVDTNVFAVDTTNNRVGVNTNTPQATLDVQATSGVAMRVTNTGVGDSFRVEDTTSDTTPFVIDASGNVGIGTISPQATLDVQATGSSNAMRITNTGTGNSFLVEDGASTDNSPFVIDNNGNVGIGKTNPVALLDINGQTVIRGGATTDGISLAGNGSGSSNYAVLLQPATLTSSRTLTLPDATGTVINTGNLSSITSTGTLSSLTVSGDVTVDTNTFKVDSINNRVGILTASPASGYQLDVEGAVRATNYFVGTNTTTKSMPRGIIDYKTTSTTPVSITTEAIQLTSSSFTAVANRIYRITYYEPQILSPATGGAFLTYNIRLTNVAGTKLNGGITQNALATSVNFTAYTTWTGTLSAGSTIIVATLASGSGTYTVTRSATTIGILTIEDLGTT